jgi:hypothetical protein
MVLSFLKHPHDQCTEEKKDKNKALMLIYFSKQCKEVLMIKFDKGEKTGLSGLSNRSIRFWQFSEPNRGMS